MPLPFHDQPEQVQPGRAQASRGQPGRRLRRLVGLVALAVPLLAWLAPAGTAQATQTTPAAHTSPATHGADVTVAVAANFAAPMKRIAQAFERASGHRVVASYASTGKLYTQIVQGAPFQVLLAADAKTPERLQAEGRAVAGSRFTYATGRLALWSRNTGVVDAQGAVLRSDRVSRLAIANPKLAPYGAAALQVLQRLGLQAALAPRLVTGESIAQAWQFTATGNAPLGFVALSQVMQDGTLTQGSAWVVPADLHDAIRQDAVLLQAGKDHEAAKALLHFLRSDEARRLIRDFGYEP